MPILTHIPVASLPPAAQELARELDKSRLVARNDGAARDDGQIGPSEVRAALSSLTSFSPSEQGIIQQWAQLLGVDGGAPAAPVKREWQDRENLPRDQSVYKAVAVGPHLYASSGEQGYCHITRFDPKTNTWTEVQRPHQSLYHGSMNDPTLAEAGGQLYAIGGGDRGRHVWPYGYRFDPSSKSWTQIANNPSPRWGMGAAGLDGKLYVFGGTTKNGYGYGASPFAGAKEASNLAQVYDPAANSWTSLPPLPVARAHPGVIAHDGKVFVIGGLEAGGPSGWGGASRRVDVFDPATQTWRDPPLQIPTGVVNPSVWLSDDGKICVSGGHNQDQKAVRTVETLDPATGQTGELAPVKFEEAGYVSLANVGGELVALGSYAGDRRLDVETKAWAAVEPPPGTGTSIVNIITHNVTTNLTQIDITNIIQNIQNTTVVNNIIDASTTQLTVVDASQSYNLEVLSPLLGFGFSDVDNNFFLRPTVKDKPVVQVGTLPDGKRYLVGSAHQGKGPLPKSASLCLYDPASQRAFPFSSDAAGQFALELPADVRGRVFLYRTDGGAPSSSAAPLELP